jgi:hypothetical protein
MYFAAAWPAGISLVSSRAALLPSLIMPSFIGVPVAGFEGPSRDWLAPAPLDEPPDDAFEPLLHPARIRTPQASTANAACRSNLEPTI